MFWSLDQLRRVSDIDDNDIAGITIRWRKYQAWLQRCECHGEIRIDSGTDRLRTVRRKTRRNIDGKNRCFGKTNRQTFDDRPVKAFNRPHKPRSQKCVDDQCGFFFTAKAGPFGFALNHDRTFAELFEAREVSGRIAGNLSFVCKEQYVRTTSTLGQ